MKLYNAVRPVQYCSIDPHVIVRKKKIYIWARFGFRWIMELATPYEIDGVVKEDNKSFACVIVEGSPKRKFFKLTDNEVAYMQRKLSEHLCEYYKWIQVTEILMPKERR